MSLTYCSTLQGNLFYSLSFVRYCSILSASRLQYFSRSFSSSVPERTRGPTLSPVFVIEAQTTFRKLPATKYGHSGKTLNSKSRKQKRDGFSSSDRKASKTEVKNDSFGNKGDSVEDETENERIGRSASGILRGLRLPSKSELSASAGGPLVVKIKKEKENGKGDLSKGKGSKKGKPDSPSGLLRVGLDMCSKNGDVIRAINLYDKARREGVKMSQHHYSVLLYLCSSAAGGVVQPGKSGTGSRTLNATETSTYLLNVELGELTKEAMSGENILSEPVFSSDGQVQHDFCSDETEGNVVEYLKESMFVPRENNLTDLPRIRTKQNNQLVPREGGGLSIAEEEKENQEVYKIRVSEDVKKYALQRGFEIYECMNRDEVLMNEATLTAVARMAMSFGDGEMAFEMVKKMKSLGINPRLRSYGPALTVFCNRGDVEKAFSVEKHMLENGVYLEEPELEALLRLSVTAGKDDKVYYLLHKLRTSVRHVSIPTAHLIISWFRRKEASRVGKRKWSPEAIDEAIKNNGGGWHGLGWFGKGKWNVFTTTVDADGICESCGKRLAIIDLDQIETEKFAESVASLAMQREKKSSFQTFQKWLDNHGPFEVVVDGANVGLFGQRQFTPFKVKTLVDGIHEKLRLKKWPLVVLHNRRLIGGNIDKPVNRALVEKWKSHDALYATPTGSNDDWYWLYAAIKYKCLIVTNDEMRDHTFQLLGNNFFLKWKERHQVRFSFSDNDPEFHMPPAYSTVIQESEEGHWHVPVTSHNNLESDATIWLCITRGG